jgi:hypothetical protein
MAGTMLRLLTLIILISSALLAQEFTAGALAGGTFQGPGLEVQATAAEFAQGFPFILRFAAGYYSLDPGNAEDARRIFINDATNGVPEKRGHFIDLRLDFLYPVEWFGWQRLYLYGGPRRLLFTGNFEYIGGNEDFAVTSNSWGAGMGLEKQYAISRELDLLLCAGFDYQSKSALYGHDTEYAPNGESVNGRKEYTYADADKAIHQPVFVPRLLIGASYRF